MINCKKGEIHMEGTIHEIETDLVLLIKSVREKILVPKLGEDKAEERILKLVENSKKTEDDLDKEIKDNIHQLFSDILKDILGSPNQNAKEAE